MGKLVIIIIIIIIMGRWLQEPPTSGTGRKRLGWGRPYHSCI
jgi:hypothetical protein